MQSILQILKRNEPNAYDFEGRKGVSHSAECALLTESGELDQVGVLKIKGDELIAKAQPGIYRASFALRSSPASRQIEAVLMGLQPVKKSGNGFVPVDVPATPKA